MQGNAVVFVGLITLCLSMVSGSAFAGEAPMNTTLGAGPIEYISGDYYQGQHKLNFGASGGELFDLLYENPRSRSLAVSGRRKYRISNGLFFGLGVGGLMLALAGHDIEDRHEITGAFMQGAGGIMLATGVIIKLTFSHRGKVHYQMAIGRFNSVSDIRSPSPANNPCLGLKNMAPIKRGSGRAPIGECF